MSATTATIREAEEAIRRRFIADGFRGTLEYASDKVIETERWWYIPFCGIGCFGFIVSKDDLYVNLLGSGATLTLEQCFWGHDRGVFCDLVDFSFSPDTDRTLAASLLSRFKHMYPNASGVLPVEPVWYRDSEIPAALSSQFPNYIELMKKDCGLLADCRREYQCAASNPAGAARLQSTSPAGRVGDPSLGYPMAIGTLT